MCNFSYLKKHDYYNTFSSACVEAEKSLVVSYASTAILSRRALELSIKWLYSYDSDLTLPYQDNLSSLMYNYSFKDLIDMRLFNGLKYIKDLGNKAVHTTSPIKKEQAVYSLKCLYEFTSWIDYCYSDQFHNVPFDESLLHDSEERKKTRQELQDLYDRLGSKDRKLEEVRKENEELRSRITAKRTENEKARENFPVDDISEYQTRKMFIDLELEIAGWTIGSDCIIEEEVTGMPNSSGTGFVDYVLYGDDGKPLALIEAKRTSIDPRQGKDQAKLYADCLEQKYNHRPIIFYTNGFEYYIWDDLIYPERRVSGIYTKADLEWTTYKRTNKKSLNTVEINDDITNRTYQKLAIQAVCDTFEKRHRKALLVMATGSGKTRTAISLVDVLLKKGWIKNILFLADRITLVKQAKNNFSNLLPDLSLCNLLNEKDSPESKMIFSTYPTMMNAIDDTKGKDGSKLFTPGHFDLIIIDESHRSIYKKYQAIFDYFDAALVGLTATPKNDIDINTYSIFDLENDVPTFAYELGEAIEEGYLVPYNTIETRMKLPEEGLHYDELDEEDKAQYEETFDEEEDFSGDDINKFLFNKQTVDIVIEDLMEKGIKVEGGDKLGKTIVFAKNKNHAKFIIERFDARYPNYSGHFAKPIYTDIKYVDKTYEDFTEKDKLPQIAVSVDMLDTGVDVPEIVNLVFFKKVRSKSKFWQMIGRGTRLCEDLFGIGLDKENFVIFDYCSNFEFFRENKNGKESTLSKSLTENLFNIRVDIVKELQRLDYQDEEHTAHRLSMADELYKAVTQIDETRFNARNKLKYIHRYNKKEKWENLTDSDPRELSEHIAPLVSPIDDDELAKRFDYLLYTIEYAQLTGKIANKPRMRVISTADELSKKGNIAMVKKQEEIIRQVQTDEYWQDATIFDHEKVRIALRDLLKFIDSEPRRTYYTNFKDEVLDVQEKPGEFSVNEFKDYRKKVNHYLKSHEDDTAIYKLKHNRKLSEHEIKHLEEILWQELGSKEDYNRAFGDKPMLELVCSIVGLEAKAANEQFSRFLSDESLNKNQMEFVKMIVRHVIQNGLIEKKILNEQPFNKFGSIVDLFSDRMDVAKEIVAEIDRLNGRVVG
ncbi:MAG: DEAD/DEAH box helicase family protein [Spirochaetales bacterium]|nr:DEAD/DEAH box helicase family protein [Spirochaetales bacterium]